MGRVLMTKEFLNTLYIGTEGAYARLDNETVRIEREGQKILAVPLHMLSSIVLFGTCTASMPLMMKCAEDGRAFVLLDRNGRFRARVEGPTSGNVLLRKAQYDAQADPFATLALCRCLVAGKLQNARQVLLRGARDLEASGRSSSEVREAAEVQAAGLARLSVAMTTDEVRGVEGLAAQAYFGVFDLLVTNGRTEFRFDGRSRRPPLDRANCLMSFLYSLWKNECVSALESVGLDPQFGFLHVLRPGRPALALDLMEEFRAVVLDRLALSLINRRQVDAEDFEVREGGAVSLTDDGRKKVLQAYQKRKSIEVPHRLFVEKVPIGLLPFVQARLLARCLRGDLECYVPYLP
ncbi:type I-C CRISPR-associated endonuclease Cas1c [soil metagenome]